MSDIKTLFEGYAKDISNLRNRPSDNDLLILYGYYKQATVGKCNTECPSVFDPTGRSKWNAWNKLGSMTKEDAMFKYCEFASNLIPKYS